MSAMENSTKNAGEMLGKVGASAQNQTVAVCVRGAPNAMENSTKNAGEMLGKVRADASLLAAALECMAVTATAVAIGMMRVLWAAQQQRCLATTAGHVPLAAWVVPALQGAAPSCPLASSLPSPGSPMLPNACTALLAGWRGRLRRRLWLCACSPPDARNAPLTRPRHRPAPCLCS